MAAGSNRAAPTSPAPRRTKKKRAPADPITLPKKRRREPASEGEGEGGCGGGSRGECTNRPFKVVIHRGVHPTALLCDETYK